MRWFRLLLVAVCLCVLLGGCGRIDEATSASSASYQQFCSADGVHIYDYSAYLDFISNACIPNPFISYEAVRHFGAFDGFVGYWDYMNDQLLSDRYIYFLRDSSGNRVGITIDQTIEEYNREAPGIISEVNKADMRFLPGDVEHGALNTYIIFGIEYFYKSEKLLYIYWRDDERTYCLDGNPLYTHPLDDTVVGQLLNIEGKTEAELYALLSGVDIAG